MTKSALAHLVGRAVAAGAVHLGDERRLRVVGKAGVDHPGKGGVALELLGEDLRGRGLGAADTWAATMADPTLPAMLIASDLGRPVYERMGYLRLTRFALWLGPRDGATS